MAGPSIAIQQQKEVLRELWYRWLAVVELFARRRAGQHRLAEQEYRALREDLLRACRSLAEAAGAAGAGRYEALEGLVEPWLTLRTLGQADKELLFDLRERCQQIGQALGGPPWRFRARVWARLGLVLAPFVVGFVLLSWTGNRVWQLGREYATEVSWALRWGLE